MKHLAARFIPKIGEQFLKTKSGQFNLSPIHVVDPNLDFREQFKNVEKLRANLEMRKMVNVLSDLPKIRDEYFCWWKAYVRFAGSDVNKEDVNKRYLYYEFRGELLKNSGGLLAVLSLPNSLDVKQNQFIQRSELHSLENDLDEVWQNVRSNTNFNDSSIFFLRDLRSSFFKFTKKSLKHPPIPISGPFLVRPALVECCNIDLNEFPLITDGIDSPLCLVGTHIPSFLSILVNGLLSSLNDWPISLLTSGPIYQRSLTDLKQFNQNEQISILTLGRNNDECTERQQKIYEIFSAFLLKFLRDEIEIFEKKPEELQLWERSSTFFGRKINGDEVIQLASLSNIGEYISRRAHVLFNNSNKKEVGKEDNDKKNYQNYVHMAYATLNLDTLCNEIKILKS